MSQTREEFLANCFIQDWVDGSYLAFQLMPEEINEQKTASWQDHEIMGRSMPVSGYSSSGPRTVSLQLYFVKEIDAVRPKKNLKNTVAWLRSFAYPDYAGNVVHTPHPVYLHLADMVKMKAVVLDVQVSYKAPWDILNDYTTLVEVSMSFKEIGEVPQGLQQIRDKVWPYSAVNSQSLLSTRESVPTGED